MGRKEEIRLPAEDQTKGEHQIGNVTRCLGRVHRGDNSHGECRGEQEEHLHVQPHEERSDADGVGHLGVAVVPDGVVPAQEEYGSDEHYDE